MDVQFVLLTKIKIKLSLKDNNETKYPTPTSSILASHSAYFHASTISVVISAIVIRGHP